MTRANVQLPMMSNSTDRGIATTVEVDRLLALHAPVAIGVSGGKDSSAVALATCDYLDSIEHEGPRVLIHADLGVTEWRDSLPTCERLADRLGVELVVVRRPQGDMMDRWEQRWRDNVARWETLSCVKLILPWSTPAMRFCTAELKVDQICRHLSRRFPGQSIINATGIRRAESTERAKAPVSKTQPKLASVTRRTLGVDWNPIIDWSTPDVFEYLQEKEFPLHEAYTVYGASRVSCVFCILATQGDHFAGTRAEENRELARRMVALEIRSTFAFQGSRWLGDTVNACLTPGQRLELLRAKSSAAARVAAEKGIPADLLYTRGWPNRMPSVEESNLLARIRAIVANAVGLRSTFTDGREIRDRYAELMARKAKAE